MKKIYVVYSYEVKMQAVCLIKAYTSEQKANEKLVELKNSDKSLFYYTQIVEVEE